MITGRLASSSFFFFNDTATTEIYTLSLHDALPISLGAEVELLHVVEFVPVEPMGETLMPSVQIEEELLERARRCRARSRDRKSTRLNSSHSQISYAVFCLKKKKKSHTDTTIESWID